MEPKSLKVSVINWQNLIMILGKDAEETWEIFIEKAKQYVQGDKILSIFVRKINSHSNKIKESKGSQKQTSTSHREQTNQENNSNQSQFFYQSSKNLGIENSYQSNFMNHMVPVPFHQFNPFFLSQQMNSNPFLDLNQKKTEEMVKQMVYQMFEQMKQEFNQKMLNIQKNQAQHENIINQLINEVRILKNNKKGKKATQEGTQDSEEKHEQDFEERPAEKTTGKRRGAKKK